MGGGGKGTVAVYGPGRLTERDETREAEQTMAPDPGTALPSLDVPHEPPRDPAPPTPRIHRQPVQVTTPTVPAADQARDQALAIPGEDEQVPIAPEPSSERIRTIARFRPAARARCGPPKGITFFSFR